MNDKICLACIAGNSMGLGPCHLHRERAPAPVVEITFDEFKCECQECIDSGEDCLGSCSVSDGACAGCIESADEHLEYLASIDSATGSYR